MLNDAYKCQCSHHREEPKIIDKKSFDGDRVRSLVTDQADFVLLDSQKKDLSINRLTLTK